MLKDFLKQNKWRYIIWGIAIGIAVIFLIIAAIVNSVKNPNMSKQTILVNAPAQMITAFNKTFEELKLDKDYVIEYTDDVEKANFKVSSNLNNTGKQIAYSPIISVINSDETLYESLIKEKYLIEYEKESDYYDLDFNKIINEIITDGSKFKIYYPAKNTGLWEEFYSLLLFTVNDGIYPKQPEELKVCQEKIDKFLNSKSVEPIDISNLKQFNGFSNDSIYFMTYADLAHFFNINGGISCREIYPKITVYEGYYASYDEIGKIIYNSLYTEAPFFGMISTNYTGLYYLRTQHYYTDYYTNTFTISDKVLGNERGSFNGVQIPNSKILIYEEE